MTPWQRRPPDWYWKPERLAWVAGIIEGEGSIRIHKSRYSPRVNRVLSYPLVSVQMTDEDVLLRLQEWTGLGKVLGPYSLPSRPTAKPLWMWRVHKKDEATALIVALWPWLCERRRAQARSVLLAFREGGRRDALGAETA